MRLREYATPDEFVNSDYCDDPDDVDLKEIAKLLRRSSGVIEILTRTAVYETDDEGLPTDIDVQDAMRDAVCAQVAYFLETGDASGAAAAAPASSIGSLSLGGKAQAGRDLQESRYSPEAIEILSVAGLTSGVVRR